VTHAPEQHVTPAPHAFPHVPQLSSSLASTVHLPEHGDSPEGHEMTATSGLLLSLLVACPPSTGGAFPADPPLPHAQTTSATIEAETPIGARIPQAYRDVTSAMELRISS
jgi:hypothetical protein